MGLLDELEGKRKRARRVYTNRKSLPPAPWGTHWVTPRQAARENKQQQRQALGLIIAIAGWVVAMFLSTAGPAGLVLGVTIGVLFSVWGVVTAFSNSDKELKR